MKIKMVLTDVDGCLTDNSVYYNSNGEKTKRFSMYDGMGTTLLRNAGILTGIISGDNSEASRRRAMDLGMEIIYVGVKNKLELLNDIMKKHNLSFEEVAYMGDDVQDLEIIKKVALSCAPANAIDDVKENVSLVTKKNGGDGAFREFAEYILKNNL